MEESEKVKDFFEISQELSRKCVPDDAAGLETVKKPCDCEKQRTVSFRLFSIALPIASRKIPERFVRAAGGYLGGRLFGSAP